MWFSVGALIDRRVAGAGLAFDVMMQGLSQRSVNVLSGLGAELTGRWNDGLHFPMVL